MDKTVRLVPVGETRPNTLTRGGFYTILRNPVYVGMIRHKKEVYPGQHEAIVQKAIWDAVQENMDSNCRNAGRSTLKRDDFPLRGKLFDQHGQLLKPHATRKNGRRYRYYVLDLAQRETVKKQRLGCRLAASEIERRTSELVRAML